MNSDEEQSSHSLSDEQYEELEGLAGMNYFTEELAIFFDVPVSWINAQLRDESSQFKFHFDRGKLLSKAKLDLALKQSAEARNVNAILALVKRNKEAEMREFRESILK